VSDTRTPKPNAKPVAVRLPAELAERIDRLRGDLIKRETYVRWLVTEAVEREEAKARRKESTR
jgi:hypothetical protein